MNTEPQNVFEAPWFEPGFEEGPSIPIGPGAVSGIAVGLYVSDPKKENIKYGILFALDCQYNMYHAACCQ